MPRWLSLSALFFLVACGDGSMPGLQPERAARLSVVPAAPAVSPSAASSAESSKSPTLASASTSGPALPSRLHVLSDAANHALVNREGGQFHVGADVAPSYWLMTPVKTYDGVEVSRGETTNYWLPKEKVASYLYQMVDVGRRQNGSNPDLWKWSSGLMTFPDAPVVRIAEGTTREWTDQIVRAVQAVNAYMPKDRRLRIDPAPAPSMPTLEEDMSKIPDGQIFVEVLRPIPFYGPSGASLSIWVGSDGAVRMGILAEGEVSHMKANLVWIDHDSNSGYFSHRAMGVLVHELLHAVGMSGHVAFDEFRGTWIDPFGTEISGSSLSAVDGEVLHLIYSRFKPGDLPSAFTVENLGDWSMTTKHVRGDVFFGDDRWGDWTEQANFGVAFKNGLAQPWAQGMMPDGLLRDAGLSGTAAWKGRLVGFTPKEKEVGGAATLSVSLSTLRGDLAFTDLAYMDGGGRWLDGDLTYKMAVVGNEFAQTGGDKGFVTGVFVGRKHGGMAGVLERDDLTAAFGGKR